MTFIEKLICLFVSVNCILWWLQLKNNNQNYKNWEYQRHINEQNGKMFHRIILSESPKDEFFSSIQR